MKRIIFILIGIFFVCVTNAAVADVCGPAEGTKKIIACMSGYYLAGNTCIKCPAQSGATSANRNDTGISACSIPAGTKSSDARGTFEYTSNCPYK